MIDVLIAWALFTTLLGGMAVAGWIACERSKRTSPFSYLVWDGSDQIDSPGFEDTDNPWRSS